MFKKKQTATDPLDNCLPCKEDSCSPIKTTEEVYDSSLAERLTELEKEVENLEFTDLIDTPNTYVGQKGKIATVNASETGLIFTDKPIGGGGTSIVVWNQIDANLGDYDLGTFVSHLDKIWKSNIDDNTVEPSLSAPQWTAQSVEDFQAGVLKETVTSNTHISDAAPSGTIFNIGMDLTEVLKKIAIANNITYISPSFSLSNDRPLSEIGSTQNVLLTFNFNRGEIRLNGAYQNPRAGAATSYTINGTTQGSNTLTVSNYVVQSGTNSFNGTVTYAQGAQPLDLDGNPVGAPLPAGTSPVQTTSFQAIYPVFYGVMEPSEGIGDLDLSILTKAVVSSTGTITIPYSGVVGKRLVILHPSTSTTKTKWWVNALNNGNIGNTGDLFSTVATQNLNSPSGFWSNISYKIYISEPTSINVPIELRNS